MKEISWLILQARRMAENLDKPDGDDVTVGLTDEEILQFFNDAQDRIQTLISGANSTSKPFVVEKTLSVVAEQEEYTLGDRLFYNKEIELVEYSPTGLASDYFGLDLLSQFNRSSDAYSPYGYYKRQGKICLIPPSDTSVGSLRILYERQLDDLDIRRGKISTVTGLTSTTFTSITIDSSADESSTPNLSTIDYICICDGDGVVQARNIPVLSYDTGTNILTPAVGYTFDTDETIAVGNYVTFHKWTTTHSGLTDECEGYLVQYAWEQIALRDGAEDLERIKAVRMDMEGDIIRQYASQTGEVQIIPQLDWDDWT